MFLDSKGEITEIVKRPSRDLVVNRLKSFAEEFSSFLTSKGDKTGYGLFFSYTEVSYGLLSSSYARLLPSQFFENRHGSFKRFPLSLIHISEPTRQAESRMPSSA